ncbi:MAG: ABC transporter substrate-binding protein [Sphingomonadales bacterium]|nr:ABC transporter substrate-binding protein [Sphingomonadales bacterium]
MLPLLLAGCTPVPAASPRIASLNPCTDAILAEVADPGQIAALSAFSRRPGQSSMDLATARRLPSSEGTVEDMVALRPAQVLTGTFTPPATRAAYARLGIPLAEFPIAATVAESEAQVRRIAALAGHPERGAALVGRMRAALAQAAPPRGSRPLSALVWQAGGMVPGQATLIAELLARTGFASFSAARGLGQGQVLPLEAVLADPPDVILAAGSARAQENRLLHHPALAALRRTRTFSLDPALEWCAGPTVIRAAARLAQIRRSVPG